MTSTSGRPSTPERGSSPAAAAADDPVLVVRAGHAIAAGILNALKEGNVTRMRQCDKWLKKDNTSLLEVVAAARPEGQVDSLLHLGARWVQYEACRYLLKDLHLDVNAVGEHAIDGINPASTEHKKNESLKIVNLLIRRGGDPNKPKPDGFTPLHAAALKDSHEIAKSLLESGAQVNAVCPGGMFVDAVQQLDQGDPNSINISGFTALHVAVIKGSLAVAELLLEKKAEVDAMCNKGTALLIASESGAGAAMVKLLLGHGANPNKTNTSGFTGLHFATLRDSLDLAKLLLGKGANVHAVCKKGTALHIAAGRGSLKLVILLLQNDANADVADSVGRKPIEVAAVSGYRACVEILFEPTTLIPEYVDWSVEGIIRDAKNQIHD